VTATLRRRIERLEVITTVADGVVVMLGRPSEEEVERLHAAGVLTIITVPRNGRETGGELWRRSGFD
jgi:hypothetical protein